jgi:tetratricopeptide (TPR) repeat protein/tRNA A-37 threonylcarbamoyl transferase component Bud32
MPETPSVPTGIDRVIDGVCDRFEAAWKAVGDGGARPRLADFPVHGLLGVVLWLWRLLRGVFAGSADEGGARPRLADFLADAPGADPVVLLKELLYLDRDYRKKAGEEPVAADYRADFPDLGAAIDAVFGTAEESAEPVTIPLQLPTPPADDAEERRATPHPEPPTEDHVPAEPTPPSATEQIPVLPGYEIRGELGRGGMGVVYKAWQPALKRFVALKMIRDQARASTEKRVRFQIEAEAVAGLQHPHIVRIYEIGEHGGLPFFSLEFCDGGSLAARQKNGPLPVGEASLLLEQLARAMAYAHARGVVHRDLKPANVLFTADGEPKVADFGLAKRLDAEIDLSEEGRGFGTANYVSPEQARGQVRDIGPPTDVYALSAVLYELLTGSPPYEGGRPHEVVARMLKTDLVPPSRLAARVPRDLEAICLKGMSKDLDTRFKSAGELADELQRWREGRPIRSRAVPAWERALKWVRRRPTLAALIAAIVLAVIALAVGGLFYGLYKEQQADADRQKALTAEGQAKAEKEKADTQKHEFERLTALRRRIDSLQEQGRSHEERKQWQEARDRYHQALAALDSEPALAGEDLHRTLTERLGHVVREMDREAGKQDMQERIARFVLHYEEMSFREISLSDDEAQENRKRVRREAEEALRQFDGKAGLAARRGVLEEARFKEVGGKCCLVLLAWAEATDDPSAALALVGEAADVVRQFGLVAPRALTLQRAACLIRLGQLPAAVDVLRQAGDLSPQTAQDHFQDALTAYRQGSFSEALLACERALGQDSGFFWAHYLRALCHLRALGGPDTTAADRRGHAEKAEASLEVCLGQQKTFAWARLLRGVARIELGKFHEAEEDFADILKQNPDKALQAAARTSRGAGYFRQGEFKCAVADLKIAATLQPDSFRAHLNLSKVYKQSGDPAAALAALEQALAHLRGNPVLLYTRADLYLELSHDARQPSESFRGFVCDAVAQLTLERYIDAETDRTSPRLVRSYTELARLHYKAGRYDEAVKACDAAIALRPSYGAALRQKADAYAAQECYGPAARTLDRYLETVRSDDPDALALAYVKRGLLHYRVGEYRHALEAYNRSMLWRPPEPRTLILRGETYLALDSPRLAQADFEAVLFQWPPPNFDALLDALCGRGWALVLQGDTASAMRDANMIYDLELRNARLLVRLAGIYAQAVDQPRTTREDRFYAQERALKLVRQAVALQPPAEEAAFWQDVIRLEPGLAPLHGSTGWKALDRQYPRP